MQFGSKKLSLIITTSVLALFLVYFVHNIEQFKPLLHLNIFLLLIISLVGVVVIFVNGLFTKVILQPFHKYISVLESAYVALISAIGNFFAPVGAGFGFRAVYLKKKHGLPYSDFISTLSGNYVIVFLVNSFFALVALYFLRGHDSSQYAVLVTLFGIIFLGSLAVTFIKVPKRFTEVKKTGKAGKVLTPAAQVLNGWSKIVTNKKMLYQLTVLIIINFFLSLIIAKLEISALHFHIGAAQLLLFSVLGALSLFINITPANLGVKEAIYIFSASVIGFSTSQILLISLVDRGVQFITLSILWLLTLRMRHNPLDVKSEDY